MPDFTLRDQDGKTVSAASLRGRPVVFAFIYSTCRDTCPAQVQTIRNALDELPAAERDRVQVIGVSVDPANDTAKRAQSFLLKQQMTGPHAVPARQPRAAGADVGGVRRSSRRATSSSTPPTPCWPTPTASSASASRTTT